MTEHEKDSARAEHRSRAESALRAAYDERYTHPSGLVLALEALTEAVLALSADAEEEAAGSTLTRPFRRGPLPPRSRDEVARDVAAWQDRLLAGVEPGPVPISESGWPFSYEAARTYFGPDVAPGYCRNPDHHPPRQLSRTALAARSLAAVDRMPKGPERSEAFARHLDEFLPPLRLCAACRAKRRREDEDGPEASR